MRNKQESGNKSEEAKERGGRDLNRGRALQSYESVSNRVESCIVLGCFHC